MKIFKLTRCVVSACLFCLVCSNSLSAEMIGTLIVEIDGFPDSEGYAMVAVFDSESAYKEGGPRAAEAKIKVVDQKARAELNELPYGTYAVAMYHDRNANGKMDKNAMGIPKEPYGHSNNARGILGPPSYNKAKFELNNPQKKIRIRLD